MPGLIHEISELASDPATRIGSLLRKMKIAAVRLRLDALEDWVAHELDGYGPDVELPEYRVIQGIPQNCHSHWGWRTMKPSEDRDAQLLWSSLLYRQPIDGLESILGSTEPIRLTYPDFMERAALPHMPHGVIKLGLLVDRSQLVNVVNGVRDRVLDWSLAMEKAGVTGEQSKFTTDEIKKAQSVTIINVNGPNSRANINSTDNSTNTVIGGDLFGDLRARIQSEVADEGERASILATVDDMEEKRGTNAFVAAYGRFMQAAANHIQVIQPFLEPLGNLLDSL